MNLRTALKSAGHRASLMAAGSLIMAGAALAVLAEKPAQAETFNAPVLTDDAFHRGLKPSELSAQEAAPTPAVAQAGNSLLADAPVEPKVIAAGMASFYGAELAGRRTASGERFNPEELTAAHRTLPFGTKLRVTNPRTGKFVVVRINDRGPFHGNRLIDLSREAAERIGIVRAGSGRVELAIHTS